MGRLLDHVDAVDLETEVSNPQRMFGIEGETYEAIRRYIVPLAPRAFSSKLKTLAYIRRPFHKLDIDGMRPIRGFATGLSFLEDANV